jgi:hypothetical protein
VGLLTLAGLAACGDSGQDITPGNGVVHTVTVSPTSLPLAVGGTGVLSASVDADASITDRTVTWTSSDPGVATVDAATGKVTGVKAGTTTVTAKANANPAVQAGAVVTVAGSNGNGAVPTVTISSINQTTGVGSVPVNLGNVAGQIDVTLNVETNGGTLKTVTAMLKCGTDSIINTQTVSNLAPVSAEAASSPVTLSFNTAAFSTAGVAALHNGTCTISATATTASGTQSAVNSTQLTLNNADVITGSVAYGATKTDAAGLAWVGKSVTVTVLPVFYTAGRTAATTTVTLNAGGAHTQTLTDTGSSKSTQTITFTDANDGKNSNTAIDQITDPLANVTVSTIDSNGQPFANTGNVLVSSVANPLAPVNVPAFRLDTQKPLAGTFVIANNAGQGTSANGYINGGFKFQADSASGYCGPNSAGYAPGNVTGGVSNGTPACTSKNTANIDSASTNKGVDNVTVTFVTRVAGAAKTTEVAATSPSALAESQTAAAYTLSMITTDALGNADTTDVGNFGVDLTAPSTFASTQTTGPQNQTVYTTTGTNGPDAGGQQFATSGITDNLSGPGPLLVAQTRNISQTGTLKASTYEGKTYTNTGAANTVSVGQAVTDKSPCVIGRFNASQTNAGASALSVYNQSGTQIGYCTPVAFNGNTVPPDAAAVSGGSNTTEGYFTTEIIGADQAGNRSAPFVSTIVADATGPTVTSIDLPQSIAANSQVGIPAAATDSVDLVASYATVHYPAYNLRYAKTALAGVVAFDNTLTRAATITPVISSFIRNLAPPTAGTPATTGNTTNSASSIDIGAVDEAFKVGELNAPLTIVSLGTAEATTSFDSTNFTGGFVVAADSATITNCPTALSTQTTGCGAAGKTTPVHPTSVNLTASASGKTGTFVNPFATVTFWYQEPTTGDYVQVGSTSSATVTDTGAGNGRTWSYKFTWDPPVRDDYNNVFAPQFGSANVSVNLIAVGTNAAGDAVSTTPVTIQLSNP